MSGEKRGQGGEAFDKSETQDKKLEVRTRDKEEKGGEEEGDKHKEKIHESDEQPEIVDSAKIKSGDMTPDKIRRLLEAGEVDISPEYRRIVERYFGELSEK